MEGVIDFHIHLCSMHYLKCPVMLQLKEENPDFYEKRKQDMTDDPEALVSLLKKQGVDYAIMLPELHPFNNYDVTTEMVVEYCKNSRALIPFAHINPNTEANPLDKVKYYIYDLHCRGIKLLPSYQHFYMNDHRLYPLYSFAQEINIPVMFHIGSSTFPYTKLKYCDPLHLDEVCVDFPDLNIIACHGGRGFWYETIFFLLNLHKNLHVDIAGLPPKRLLHYFPDLEKKADRFIFGTDWPTIPSSIKENISSIEQLPISESSKEKILRSNAQTLLNFRKEDSKKSEEVI